MQNAILSGKFSAHNCQRPSHSCKKVENPGCGIQDPSQAGLNVFIASLVWFLVKVKPEIGLECEYFIGELISGNRHQGKENLRQRRNISQLKSMLFLDHNCELWRNVQRPCSIVHLKAGWLEHLSTGPSTTVWVLSLGRLTPLHFCGCNACCVSRGPRTESIKNLAKHEVGVCFLGINKSWCGTDSSSLSWNEMCVHGCDMS